MSEHRASVSWSLGARPFTYESYSRDHVWRFEAGVEIAASAAPKYLGNPERVDPEEAFVASLASCHMLTFLAVAARRRLQVEAYEDSAVGFMEKNAGGKLAITRVELRPRIRFGDGRAPSRQELERLHDLAHRECFIANSVHTEVSVELD